MDSPYSVKSQQLDGSRALIEAQHTELIKTMLGVRLTQAFTHKYLITPEEAETLQGFFTRRLVLMSPDAYKETSHPVLAILNEYANAEAAKYLANSVTHKKVTLSIGDSADSKLKASHNCTIFGKNKSARDNNRVVSNTKASTAAVRSSMHGEPCGVCSSGFECCDYKADVAVSVHSCYDISMDAFAAGFLRHGLTQCVVYYFSAPEVIDPMYAGAFPCFKVNRHAGQTISFTMGDATAPYFHDVRTWRDWMTVSAIDCGAHFITLERTRMYGPLTVLVANLITKSVPDFGITLPFAQWFPNRSLVPSIPDWYESKKYLAQDALQHYVVPDSVCIALLSYAQRTQDGSYKFSELASYASGQRREITIGNTVYQNAWNCRPEEYSDIVVSLFILGAIQRTDRTKCISAAFEYLKNNYSREPWLNKFRKWLDRHGITNQPGKCKVGDHLATFVIKPVVDVASVKIYKHVTIFDDVLRAVGIPARPYVTDAGPIIRPMDFSDSSAAVRTDDDQDRVSIDIIDEEGSTLKIPTDSICVVSDSDFEQITTDDTDGDVADLESSVMCTSESTSLSSYGIPCLFIEDDPNPGKMCHLGVIDRDLFDGSDDESLAHCVSSDFQMSAGIAVDFKTKFGGLTELRNSGCSTGTCTYLKRGERYIFYLVTKAKYHNKPTCATFRAAIDYMAVCVKSLGVKRVFLPYMIGCGLDRLDWDWVYGQFEQAFTYVPVELVFCRKPLTVDRPIMPLQDGVPYAINQPIAHPCGCRGVDQDLFHRRTNEIICGHYENLPNAFISGHCAVQAFATVYAGDNVSPAPRHFFELLVRQALKSPGAALVDPVDLACYIFHANADLQMSADAIPHLCLATRVNVLITVQEEDRLKSVTIRVVGGEEGDPFLRIYHMGPDGAAGHYSAYPRGGYKRSHKFKQLIEDVGFKGTVADLSTAPGDFSMQLSKKDDVHLNSYWYKPGLKMLPESGLVVTPYVTPQQLGTIIGDRKFDYIFNDAAAAIGSENIIRDLNTHTISSLKNGGCLVTKSFGNGHDVFDLYADYFDTYDVKSYTDHGTERYFVLRGFNPIKRTDRQLRFFDIYDKYNRDITTHVLPTQRTLEQFTKIYFSGEMAIHKPLFAAAPPFENFTVEAITGVASASKTTRAIAAYGQRAVLLHLPASCVISTRRPVFLHTRLMPSSLLSVIKIRRLSSLMKFHNSLSTISLWYMLSFLWQRLSFWVMSTRPLI
jgi:hypothetical protein